ncbi:hypothetical protein DEM26_06325 [Thioclava sp. NG1]|uniref:hypothetical protein n=1 Tax=unclassified Thioclava TaxID=2621713 RepID=UPI000B53A6CE|nr:MULTISPECIES: hypothetical protein [unclassified Thioclava]OWY15326.1 hypothetical protein B6V72_01695 [Thioclava sp. F34-6]PWE50531.1 hypothetical protein DEM26_06325 [Thioclava sp. NG1]
MRVFLVMTLTFWAGSALAEPDPAQLFTQSCARCHRDAERLMARLGWALGSKTPEERREWLDDFIVSHHSPDPDSRAAIAAWLAELAS